MTIEIDIGVMNSFKLTPNYYVMLYYKFYNLPHKMHPNTQKALVQLGFLDKSGEFTQKINELFKEDLSKSGDKELKEFLEKMRDNFPKGVKTGGKHVRSVIGSATVRKMRKFLKEYKYPKEIIVEATKAYVADRKKDNYKFMKTFTYFIDKQGEDSTLAAYCDAIENGEHRNYENRITRTL